MRAVTRIRISSSMVLGCLLGLGAAACEADTSTDSNLSGCSGTELLCGAGCVDVTQDPNNCGECGRVCTNTGSYCIGGTCTCQTGRIDCGGECVDPQTNGSHCGGCSKPCAAGTFCSAGVCGGGCPTGTQACGSSCVNVMGDDEANCGACGRPCGTGQECTAGVCGCAGGMTLCNGSCINTMANDPTNCGGCGLACAAGQTCQSGVCVGTSPGTGGVSGTGGATTGGAIPTGGATTGGGGTGGRGTGGRGTGGAATGGGGTGGQGAATGTGGSVATSCADVTFTINASLSSEISTVGVVDWSANTTADEAYIDFGRDAGSWEYRAPVPDYNQSGNHTLLLGMKPSTTYSYQVAVKRGAEICASEVKTIETGLVLNGLPTVQVSTSNASAVYEGFTIACEFGMGGGMPSTGGAWTYIWDKDGDRVWWHQAAALSDCSRARMSYDGQYMYMGNVNVMGGQGAMTRVRMDGTDEKNYQLTDRHHDLAVMPDGKIVLIEHKAGGGGFGGSGDTISLFDPETNNKQQIFDVAQANPSGQDGDDSHANAVNWWPDENLFTVSALNWDSITAFTSDGNVEWIMGGSNSTFTGASWSRQHNHCLTSNSLLVFNNGGDMTGGAASHALEFQMNGNSATKIMDYATNSNTSTQTFGDVKRLPNGNTLVTFSNSGVIHEIDANAQVVQETIVNPIGYTVRRTSLYGPPPPYAF